MIKKLGQNFLVNRNIAEKEVKLADINSNDVVLEVGPGKGILTTILAERAKEVICIEIDNNLISYLEKILPKNVILINKDVLEVDFKNLPFFNKIVSNLPYQISSPVTFKFLEHGFDLGVFIYQKEFAERMTAKKGSKNYSRLSVHIYYKSFCEIIQTVSKKCFYPVPQVDSSIVRMIPRKSPPFEIKNEEFFFNLVRNLFNNRRKKISSILKNKYKIKDFPSLPYVDLRVENLSGEEIGKLNNVLFDFL